MHRDDAVEMAKNIKSLGYMESIDITDGLIHITCGGCGESNSLLIKETGPGMQRLRMVLEPDLTDACRENPDMSLPLYREVIRLREENMQKKHLLQEVLVRFEANLMAIGHMEESPSRTAAMEDMREFIKRIEELTNATASA